MKKLIFIISLGLLVLSLAGCGESIKIKSKLAVPASAPSKDNTLQTGTVAGSEDTKEPVEKPLSPETFEK